MDSYTEHLIPIRKDGKMLTMLAFIWAFMAIIIALCIVFISKLGAFAAILIVAAIYGGVYLTKQMNVEYEYIFTNGEIDVDLITGKNSRKRLLTFNCKDIERIEKYSAGSAMFLEGEYDKKSIYCNKGDTNVYCVAFKHRSIGKVCLVMQLPKKMQECMLPYLDKLLAREAFK